MSCCLPTFQPLPRVPYSSAVVPAPACPSSIFNSNIKPIIQSHGLEIESCLTEDLNSCLVGFQIIEADCVVAYFTHVDLDVLDEGEDVAVAGRRAEVYSECVLWED